jgi:uncharacterized membrane protein
VTRLSRPTLLTRLAMAAIVSILAFTAAFLAARYGSLPDLLPVHFKGDGFPNGWQYKTPWRVLIPLLVQAALASTLGSIAMLLLSRSDGASVAGSDGDRTVPADVHAAATAAEAVILIALIWIAFQAYAALALAAMWQRQRAGLGVWYPRWEYVGIVLTIAVGVRAQRCVGRPEPRLFVAQHWRFGQLYKNPDDPALFVPTRDGSRWTLNFGRPIAAALIALILGLGVLGPTIILGLLLR